MIDIQLLEQRFREWRGEQAAQQDIFLRTATLIAVYVNVHDLPAIQQELVAGSETFNLFGSYNGTSIFARLLGTLAYIKLATDDYIVAHDEAAPISAEEREALENIQTTLDTLYGKISTAADPNAWLYQKLSALQGITTLLDSLTANTRLWLTNHALNSSNPVKSQGLCLSLYTILRILELSLDGIPHTVTPLIRAAGINIPDRTAQITEFLGQIATKIGEFPAQPVMVVAMVHIDAPLGANDAPLGANDAPLDANDAPLDANDAPLGANDAPLDANDAPLDANDAPLDANDVPLDANDVPLDANNVPLAAEEDDENFLDCEEAPPPVDNAPPPVEHVPPLEEDEKDIFHDFPPPITLQKHFDAQALTILSAEEHTLPEKIRRIQGALELANAGLTRLIELKTRREELITRQTPARTIIDAIAQNNDRPTGKQSASYLIRANQSSFNVLLGQIPQDELAAWEALQIQLAPAARNMASAAGTYIGSTIGATATNLFHRLPTRIQQTVNAYVPAPEDPLAVALDNLAKRHFQALREERFTTERLMDTIINQLAGDTNQLAGDTHAAKILLINAPITELKRLSRINQAAQGVMTEYARLVHHIVTTQQKLRDASGLDEDLDAFIVNYNSILVAISLFLSHYLGSFFKTNTADKIVKARTMQNTVREWKEDYEAELQRDIDDIRNNPGISISVKTAFAESVNSLRTAPDLPVIALPAAGADLPAAGADPLAEDADLPAGADLPVVAEPIAIVQRPPTTKIGSDFALVQTLFNSLTPPPPPVEQVEPARPPRGIVM